MSYSREQLLDALRRADAAGDTQAASAIARRIQEIDSKPSFEDEYQNILAEDASQMGYGETALVGIGKGMMNVANGARELWANITDDQDALDRVNRDQEEAKYLTRALDNQGGLKGFTFDAGEFTGEVVATAPIGGLAGAGGKAVVGKALAKAAPSMVKTGKVLGTTAEAAIDGMVDEALLGDGDYLTAAGLGVVGQGAVSGLGKIKDKLTPKSLTTERRVLNRALKETQDNVTEKADQIYKDGGFYPSSADLPATPESLAHKSTYMNTPEYSAYREGANDAIKKRADELIDSISITSPVDGPRAGQEIAEELSNLRKADSDAVDKAWSAFRESDIANQPLDVTELTSSFQTLLNKKAKTGNERTLAKQLKAELKEHGLFKLGKKEPPTLAQLSDARTALNEYYSHSWSPREKRLFKETVQTLDNYMDATGGTKELRTAIDASKNFYRNWNGGDLVEKLTTTKNGSDMLKTSPDKLSDLIFSRSKSQDFDRLRKRIKMSPGGVKAWNNLKAVPLLEAFEKAMSPNGKVLPFSGEQAFNHNAFTRYLSKFDQEKIWGAEFKDKMKKATDAWSILDRMPERRGTMHVSGNDKIVKDIAAYAATKVSPVGGIGTFMVFKNILDGFTDSAAARRKIDDALRSGQGMLTTADYDYVANKVKEAVSQNWKGTDMEKHLSTIEKMLMMIRPDNPVVDSMKRGLVTNTSTADTADE